jgi:hypothetical protein
MGTGTIRRIKKKGHSDLDGEGRGPSNQEEQRNLGYIQNQEQNTSTLWQRIKNQKNDG